MSKESEGKSFFEKLAAFIIDKRNLLFFFYAAAIIFSIFSQAWVKICNDITVYLPADTETRQGLIITEDELVTYGSARVMISNVTYGIADKLAERIKEIDGVASVTFDGSEDHFVGTDALFDISFAAEAEDEISVAAMDAIKAELAPYDYYISSSVGYSLSDMLDGEMAVILVIAAVIIVLVLLLTSRTYAEILVLLMTFGAAAILNMGTNFIFGEISFVSDSVAIVLQLALSIDYAIILLHRFTEERELYEPRQAAINALSKAIPEISASSLTTVSGLMAMMFMQLRIGFDMGAVLIKAILLSMISVFTLMPGLLILFSKVLDKTKHKSFIPKIDRWGKFVVKTRYVVLPVFALCLIGGYFLSSNSPYAFGYGNIKTSRENESQIAARKITDAFGAQNITALLIPTGDYESEKALLADLEGYAEVDFAMGLANVEAMDGYMLTDRLTPRQFSEMTDVDYELVQLLYAAYAADSADYGKVIGGLDGYTVPLMDMVLFIYERNEEGYVTLDEETDAALDDMYAQLADARAQLLGENYSRLIIGLDLPAESEETFDFLKTIHTEAERYYDADNIYLVGDSVSSYDLSASFTRDNIIISVLSVAFVIIVLLFTFQSVGLPLLLILVIQGSIWINFSFPTLTDTPLFFMGYLVVTAIQMGANIDYAIVISSRYNELKQKLPLREAIIETLNMAFPTVLTSGTILASAGFLIGRISTEPIIAGIGESLGRGTVISMLLVMLVLPQLLLLGDMLVEKTRFNIKLPERTQSAAGTVYVDGRVRGRVSGVVDANIRGVIRGEVNAVVEAGTLREMPEEVREDETEI